MKPSCSDPNCKDPTCNYDNEPAPSSISTPAQDATALADELDRRKSYVMSAGLFESAGIMADAAAFLRATSQTPDAVREALNEIERCCEQLATTRSQATYDSMICDGQADTLLDLDRARAKARALSTPSASAGPQAEADSVLIPREPTRKVLDALSVACRETWGVNVAQKSKAPFYTSEWRERMKPIYRALYEAAHPQPQQADGRGAVIEVHDFVQVYNFCFDGGGIYAPTNRDKAMIEDAINCYIAECEQAEVSFQHLTERQVAIIVGRSADKAIDAADRGHETGEVEDVLERIGRRVIKAYRSALQQSPATAGPAK